MKKNKKGFTLAELVLCIGIIGIVTALGATIAKKSTARAYNMYWAAGYQNLYNALAEIYETDGQQPIANGLAHIFNEDGGNANNFTIETKNGIAYRVSDYNGGNDYIIQMRVPQPKTRANRNGFQVSSFLYSKSGKGELVPLPGNAANYVDLRNRVDLLPFYVDDGKIGRVVNNNNNITQIVPKSYRDAVCELHHGSQLQLTLPQNYTTWAEGNLAASANQSPNNPNADNGIWSQGYTSFTNGRFVTIIPTCANGANIAGTVKFYKR